MEAYSKRVTILLLLNLALFLPCLSTAVLSSNQSLDPSTSKGPIHHHDYTRFADVERHCQSVLSSATELRYDPDRAGDLKYKLSFVNGDWSQDAGQAPLLPVHESHAAAAAGHELLEAVPLASLMVLHMDTMPRGGARNAVNVSGVLSFTITRSYPELELWPGFSRLLVQLQGVYTETKSSASGSAGGEKVLCMVGDAVLPVRSSNGTTDPWDYFAEKNHAGDGWVKPPVVSDGNILVVLRYPMPATLTNRAVRGEMTSTSGHFDTIRLVSQLGGRYDPGYQFLPEDAAELDAAVAGCGDAADDDDDDAPPNMDSPATLCDIFYQSNSNNPGSSQVIMDVIPNWDCEGTDAFCSRVGPFETSRAAGATGAMEDRAFTRSAIAVQSFQCERAGGGAAARVAAVLRYVPPWEHQPTAARRTGLSGATVSAEGAWNASAGRACMAGCLGAGGGEEACRYRVTLSVRRTLSMARRGGIVGKIAAVDGSHAPVVFQQRVNPKFGSSGETTPRVSYVYTKVEQAMELRRRREKTTGFRDGFVAKSLLSYPNIAGGDAHDMASLSNLAGNLNLRFQCVARPPFVPEWIEQCCYELQILSIGSLVGSYSTPYRGSRSSMWIELLRRVRAVANRRVLNVSAEFTASRNDFLGPIPVMSVEGVYDPEDGRMHLIGCRSVHTPRRELTKKRENLEHGMDCDIEVTVEYPSTTTRWLPVGRTAKVSVASTREEGDTLHFGRTELQSVPVVYRDRQLDELVRPVLEGILCITVLSVATIILVPVAFFQLLG
ncbi:unnamed protein product [Urochloa humidicola]